MSVNALVRTHLLVLRVQEFLDLAPLVHVPPLAVVSHVGGCVCVCVTCSMYQCHVTPSHQCHVAWCRTVSVSHDSSDVTCHSVSVHGWYDLNVSVKGPTIILLTSISIM